MNPAQLVLPGEAFDLVRLTRPDCWSLPKPRGDRTRCIGAVNEADEKIRRGFSIEFRDGAGRLRGGLGRGRRDPRPARRSACLAAMALKIALPPSIGVALDEALLDFRRSLGVVTAHRGTQTAGPS